LESEVLIMAEMNELHFEIIDKNKDINLQRNKIKFLEDRIKTLETAIESHAKILARFQMTEGDKS
jgi:septal ring factor EnvC (AmiA/AmiB activator)